MELKERILEKAKEMFFQFGIRSVTMDDISNALGISKKTLYQHFADKESLADAMTEQFMSHEQCKMEELQQLSENPVAEVIAGSHGMREMLATMNPVLLYDLQKYHPKIWKKYLLQKEFFKSLVKENLLKGIETGYYRKDLNPELLAILRMETVEIVFNTQLFPPAKYGLVETQEAIIDHFLRGIVTDKGLIVYEKLINQIN